MWTAEGFILSSQCGGSSLEVVEELAYKCLCELVKRCMVQVVEWGSTGRAKICRIHDLMREMCLLKDQEENFLRTITFLNRQDIGFYVF